MKQLAKSLVIVGAMLAVDTVTAAAVAAEKKVELQPVFDPVFGLDYLQPWMSEKGLISGTNVRAKDAFRNYFPGATLYVGVKFTDFNWLGMELGMDLSASKRKNVTGLTDAGNTFSYEVRSRRDGVHADLVGFWPMIDCLELFGSIGFGLVKVRLSGQLESTTPTEDDFDAQFPLSTKRRGALRLGVGSSYMVTDYIGLRAKVGWEYTETLRLKYASDISDGKSFKNSITLALGAFVRW